MTVAQSGDSMIIDADAFGFGSGEATTEETNAQTADVLQKEEGTQNTTADDATKDASKEVASETAEASEEEKAEKQRMEEAHRLIIDTIEDQFTDLARGNKSPQELQEWFKKNPEFADIANRSKRVKDQYRRFMETPVAAAQEESQAKEGTEDDERPLTVKDWKNLTREMQDAVLKQQYERENRTTFDSYAEQYGIQDDAATRLRGIADTLFQANAEWTYKESIEAAHRALYNGKPSPVGIPTAGKTPIEQKSQTESVDLLEWGPAVSFEDFTK